MSFLAHIIEAYNYALSQSKISDLHNSLSDNIITYDDYGNMTFDGKHEYVYNANGRLIDIDDGTVTYDYDALGRLAISTVGNESTYYYYDTAGRVIAEYSTFNDGLTLTQERTYIWGGGFNEILAMDEGTSRKYMLTDSLGSVTAVYDAVAGICAFTTYDAYGNSDIAPASPYGYAGMRYAAELDGYITSNRAYIPATGRWLQKDPLGVTPNPQTGNAYAPLKQFSDGVNTYAYVNNNPIIGRDDLGLMCSFYVYCREVDKDFPPKWTALVGIVHCEIRNSLKGDDFAKYHWWYPTTIDRNAKRKLQGGKGSGTCCKNATCEQIKDCVKDSYEHKGEVIGDNCHTGTGRALGKCCLKSKWNPASYSTDPRCLEWETIYITDPATGRVIYTEQRCVKYSDLPDWSE